MSFADYVRLQECYRISEHLVPGAPHLLWLRPRSLRFCVDVARQELTFSFCLDLCLSHNSIPSGEIGSKTNIDRHRTGLHCTRCRPSVPALGRDIRLLFPPCGSGTARKAAVLTQDSQHPGRLSPPLLLSWPNFLSPRLLSWSGSGCTGVAHARIPAILFWSKRGEVGEDRA